MILSLSPSAFPVFYLDMTYVYESVLRVDCNFCLQKSQCTFGCKKVSYNYFCATVLDTENSQLIDH